MKKILAVLLALVLVVLGVFLWKGGHHALFLTEAVMEWLDEDSADQTVTLEVNGMRFSGNAFWMERNGINIYGLETGGYSMYLRGNVLYMDSGAAYTLPPLELNMGDVYRLVAGAVVHGRIVKKDGIYHFSMETEELTLTADVTAGEELKTLSVDGRFEYHGEPVELSGSLMRTADQAHPLPQPVTDAMVRSQMEPPMVLTGPLEVLLPALEDLMPLTADVELGVECGILSLSETVGLTVKDGQAQLIREGVTISLTLPEGLDALNPMTAGLLLLRSGTFSQEGDTAQFRVTLPPEATRELVEEMVPQAADLAITFEESEAVLTITGDKLTGITMTASGSVPFLVTTIPVSFSANYDIQ